MFQVRNRQFIEQNRCTLAQDRIRSLDMDATKLAAWEIAGLLDAALAYPNATPTRLRSVTTSFCADRIRETIKHEPARKAELLARYPAYDPARSRTSTLRIIERRRNAMLAGAVILPLIQEAATGRKPILGGKPIEPNLDFLVRHYWPRLSGEDPEVYETRVHTVEEREVRRRYPVAHLAAGLQSMAQDPRWQSASESYDPQDMPFVRDWVARANEIARLICGTAGLKKMGERLIELRWTDA